MWNLAAITRKAPGRRAGWFAAALLGALVTVPAVGAAGDTPKEGASSSSTGSKASARSGSSSAPKASSRSTSSASRSAPRASGRSSSASRGRPQAGTRSRAPRSRPAVERPVRRPSEIRNERSRPLRHRPERLEPSPPRRGSQPPAPPAVRPLPPPADPGPPSGSGRPSPAETDRFEPDEIDGQRPDLRRRVEIRDPDLGYRHRPPVTASPRHRPRERPRYRGHHGDYRHRHYYGCGHYGYGYGYDPFYLYRHGFYSPFFYWGLGYHGSYQADIYYGGGSSAAGRELGTGALDLDVRPDRAEVYVDGRFVGLADQFDGFPGYLWLDEGTYELAFFLEGYETAFLQYTIYPGVTIDVDLRLRKGESIRPDAPLEPERGSVLPREPADADLGRIAVVATPGDAAVYLDGHFVGTAAEIAGLPAGLIVEPGDHVIEVIRPGYESASAPIALTAGERVDLKLDLERR